MSHFNQSTLNSNNNSRGGISSLQGSSLAGINQSKQKHNEDLNNFKNYNNLLQQQIYYEGENQNTLDKNLTLCYHKKSVIMKENRSDAMNHANQSQL